MAPGPALNRVRAAMRFLSLGRPLRLLETALSSWGWYTPAALSSVAGDLEPVRQAMRKLAAATPGIAAARVGRLIARCNDLQSLWHLRVPLMQALSAATGELEARRQMAEVDVVFRAAWPEAPVTRGPMFG
jgi:hypothetical protein